MEVSDTLPIAWAFGGVMISDTGRRATYIAGAPLNGPLVPIGHFVDLKIRDIEIHKSAAVARVVLLIAPHNPAQPARTIETKL